MRILRLAFLLFWLAPLAAIAQGTATLTIDTAKPVASVSPTLYGIMTEEINYSYDGGLYAELVSNRTFQTNRGPNLENWTLIQNGDSRATIAIDKTTGPSTAIPHSLKFTVTAADPQLKQASTTQASGAWPPSLDHLSGLVLRQSRHHRTRQLHHSPRQQQHRSSRRLNHRPRNRHRLAAVQIHPQDKHR